MRKIFQLGRDDTGDIHNRQPKKKIPHQAIIQIPNKENKESQQQERKHTVTYGGRPISCRTATETCKARSQF